MSKIESALRAVKEKSHLLAMVSLDIRNQVLTDLSNALLKEMTLIIQANENDLALMDKNDPKFDRLKLDQSRIENMANELKTVVSLPDPNGIVLAERTRPNGLVIKKISVPVGVIGIIYESRPNVTVDVFSLCFKAGNACVLKGGKEAHHTNEILMSIIQKVLQQHHLSSQFAYLLPSEREATAVLLNATGLVDLCIPRGSQNLIDFVRMNAKIPVIETGAGIVHIYFDKQGDIEKGKRIIYNAKTRRVSVCNALDTLVFHQDRLSDLAQIVAPLAQKQVQIFADKASHAALQGAYPQNILHHAREADFGQEFLDYKMAIKTVNSLDEALSHIARYTSGHSEAIISENKQTCDLFMRLVDAAAVYANASTAFSDGGQFGMGSEIGISTQKLHARGPMGLEALTSYKWLIYGEGQVRD